MGARDARGVPTSLDKSCHRRQLERTRMIFPPLTLSKVAPWPLLSHLLTPSPFLAILLVTTPILAYTLRSASIPHPSLRSPRVSSPRCTRQHTHT